MFGLFGKKSHDKTFERLISTATISPHFKDGELVAFMVLVELDAGALAKQMESDSNVNRLLQIVETRIREEEDFEKSHFMFRRPGWSPDLLAQRVLAANHQMPPICSWDVSINPDGSDSIQMASYPG